MAHGSDFYGQEAMEHGQEAKTNGLKAWSSTHVLSLIHSTHASDFFAFR